VCRAGALIYYEPCITGLFMLLIIGINGAVINKNGGGFERKCDGKEGYYKGEPILHGVARRTCFISRKRDS